MKCYPCRQYYASIAFGLAKKKATIMRHFSIKLLTGPIQNGGPAVSMVLKIWAWFWIVSIVYCREALQMLETSISMSLKQRRYGLTNIHTFPMENIAL